MQIRYQVFVQEQGVPPELERDALDPLCIHVLLFEEGQALATGRMQADGHIGRVAVLPAWRGRGFGRKVMTSLLAYALQLPLERVWLSSQCHAVAFYESLGFSSYGERFMEAGIEHIHMEKRL